jgi:hypothetical protein
VEIALSWSPAAFSGVVAGMVAGAILVTFGEDAVCLVPGTSYPLSEIRISSILSWIGYLGFLLGLGQPKPQRVKPVQPNFFRFGLFSISGQPNLHCLHHVRSSPV